ncbi:MAG TPA: PaaX family transcriptional regulator C-terminal domain-containing protein [Actinocrinis sp.]|jgi:phenylacetic acid degradation operon negative regulatory protein
MPDEAEVFAVPSLTRRQETGASSARSLLLTVFGEYVLPSGAAVWTSTLLHVAAGLGVEEKAARQALNRLAADGWIAAGREGRRVRWALTGHGRTLLTEGAERIYSFGRERESWDGRWLVLLVSVPEAQRDLRHRLRNGLTWAGLGSPSPGVWVSPHSAREAEAKQVVADLGLDAVAFSFCGPFAGIGSERSMVEQAWHLGELAQAYERFVRRFAGLRPRSVDGALADEVLFAQIRLVDEWRRFPRLDPQLPLDLLPPHWIGLRAANVFDDLHKRWHDAAQRRWARLVAEG